MDFISNLAEGLFKVSIHKWKALKASVESIVSSKGVRFQARKLASLVGTAISMKLAWRPITQLYTRNLYHILNNVLSLNCWITIGDEALNELHFWNNLPRLRFESNIWPSSSGLSTKVATDASDIGWGGHTLSDVIYVAHEYFSASEAIQSSTYRELLGVNRCLQVLLDRCKGTFVFLQVDAMNLLGIINRGSPKLPLLVLARKLFWFSLIHSITRFVEWVPRESNYFTDEISKMLIPDYWSICCSYFNWLDIRWGPHTIDLFSSNGNNLCEKFYSIHWCRMTSGVNAFGYH